MSSLRSKMVQNLGPLGAYRLAGLITRRRPRILMYHRFGAASEHGKISGDLFRVHLETMLANYRIIPLEQLVTAIRNGEPPPADSIVLTIDDGFRDFYEFAYPVLKDFGVPATIYVTADFVESRIWLWPDIVSYVLQNSTVEHLQLESGELASVLTVNTDSGYSRNWSNIINACTSVTDDGRQLLINQLIERSEVNLPEKVTDEYAPLSWTELKEMSAAGINVGAHTRTHPILSKLSAPVLVEEINGCKTLLESRLGIAVDDFCYPNGQPSDYSEEVKNAVISAGFKSACVAFSDGSSHYDLYELRRHAISHDIFQFNKAVSGMEYLGYRLDALMRP